MTLFTRSLWPASVRSPYVRLVVALVVAPMLIAALLTVAAFLIAGMTEPTQSDVIAVTLEQSLVLTAAVIAFTATFGLLGVLILWATAQRGLLIWVLAGAILGTLAGAILAFGFMGAPHWVFLAITAVIGWILFVLIRRVAGVAPDPENASLERVPLDEQDL